MWGAVLRRNKSFRSRKEGTRGLDLARNEQEVKFPYLKCGGKCWEGTRGLLPVLELWEPAVGRNKRFRSRTKNVGVGL